MMVKNKKEDIGEREMEMIRLLLSEAPILIFQKLYLEFNTAEMKSAEDNLKHPCI